MQQLRCSTEYPPDAEERDCAALVADVVPLVMRTIRAEMRSRRAEGLSVPQLRALAFLNRQPGASLSDLADHIGLTLPAMSRMVEGLVERELVTRVVCAADRRRVNLALTDPGRSLLGSARQATEARLAELLGRLSPEEQRAVAQAMATLRRVFSPESDGLGRQP